MHGLSKSVGCNTVLLMCLLMRSNAFSIIAYFQGPDDFSFSVCVNDADLENLILN